MRLAWQKGPEHVAKSRSFEDEPSRQYGQLLQMKKRNQQDTSTKIFFARLSVEMPKAVAQTQERLTKVTGHSARV